ncbi:hypothetical protein C5Q97_18925 [Victivallales bacterium CCUG 44730]|nr:hypothetical protein C5Q97_18925 [Victivallales bacterium CCUG 44730]
MDDLAALFFTISLAANFTARTIMKQLKALPFLKGIRKIFVPCFMVLCIAVMGAVETNPTEFAFNRVIRRTVAYEGTAAVHIDLAEFAPALSGNRMIGRNLDIAATRPRATIKNHHTPETFVFKITLYNKFLITHDSIPIDFFDHCLNFIRQSRQFATEVEENFQMRFQFCDPGFQFFLNGTIIPSSF